MLLYYWDSISNSIYVYAEQNKKELDIYLHIHYSVISSVKEMPAKIL